MNEIIFITSLDQGPWGLNFTMTFKFCVFVACVCIVFLIFPKSPLLWYLISDYFETFFFVSSRSSPLSSDVVFSVFFCMLMLQLLLSILLSILSLLLLFQRYILFFMAALYRYPGLSFIFFPTNTCVLIFVVLFYFSP